MESARAGGGMASDRGVNALVSVVVPIYNIETYIDRCVESILAQTYSNLEVILVNDGSTDASASICDRLAASDPRVRVLHKENGGLSSARNAALPMAEGEYVTFVDGDDVVHPRYAEALVTVLPNDRPCLSCVDARQLSRQDTRLEPLVGEFAYKRYSQEAALSHMLLGDGVSVSAWGKMARKSVWALAPFPEGRVYEDLSVMARIIGSVDAVVSVNEALYGQVYRPGSITRKASIDARQYLDYYAAIQDCCDYVEKWFPDEFVHEIVARRLLEYARLGRLWSEVDNPDVKCYRIHAEVVSYLKDKTATWVFNRSIPLSIRIKAMLQGRMPALYSILFDAYQKKKQRGVRQ